ncbi:hypothetical protein AB0D27_25895 [Streptomyces sp. NPDC048415]|uniref:hypothetical protein n=1 Tax=Streptomyces sp. NPDC048415 TaxID=3154822 RepID=UPI00344AE83A
MAIVRGYAIHHAPAVKAAVDEADEPALADMCVIVDGLMRSTPAIAGIAGRRVPADRLVHLVDGVSSVALPHYEFAVSEAVRGWALGGEPAGRQVIPADTLGTLDALAACTAALGLSLWSREVFVGLLAESVRAAEELVTDGRGGGNRDRSR